MLLRACSLSTTDGVEVSLQVSSSSSSFVLQEPGLEALKKGGGAAVSATSASELLVLLSILNILNILATSAQNSAFSFLRAHFSLRHGMGCLFTLLFLGCEGRGRTRQPLCLIFMRQLLEEEEVILSVPLCL